MQTRTEVRAPDGRTFHVSVEWLPHGRRRFRSLRDRRRDDSFDPGTGGPDTDGGFGGDLGGDDALIGIAIVVGVVVLGFLFWWLLLPLLFLLLDLVLIGLLVLGGIALRVVFRRPWTVAVRLDGYDEVLAKGGVVGWNAAGRARASVAEAIGSGADPTTAVRTAALAPV